MKKEQKKKRGGLLLSFSQILALGDLANGVLPAKTKKKKKRKNPENHKTDV